MPKSRLRGNYLLMVSTPVGPSALRRPVGIQEKCLGSCAEAFSRVAIAGRRLQPCQFSSQRRSGIPAEGNVRRVPLFLDPFDDGLGRVAPLLRQPLGRIARGYSSAHLPRVILVPFGKPGGTG